MSLSPLLEKMRSVVLDQRHCLHDISEPHALNHSNTNRVQGDDYLGPCLADVYVRRTMLAWWQEDHDPKPVTLNHGRHDEKLSWLGFKRKIWHVRRPPRREARRGHLW